MEDTKDIILRSLDQKRMSRRTFLKIGTLAATELFLAGCNPFTPQTPDVPLPKVDLTPKSDPQEQFKKLSMADFWPFYKIVTDTEQKYQSKGNGDFFRSIYGLCQRVAAGTVDQQDSELLQVRDGWGEQKDKAVALATSHVSSISVNSVDQATDVPEQFKKNELTRFAQAFAPMALALPPELYLFTFGAGQTTKEYLATKSFAEYEPWDAWLELFHETTHATDINYERVKPFIQKESYLKYLTKYYEAADSVFTAALATKSPEQHLEFWGQAQFGALLALPGNSQRMDPLFTRLENELHGNSFEENGNFSRYTKLVWEVGRQLQTIHQKQLNNETLAPFETKLLNNDDVSTLMTMALQEVLHVLVDSRQEFSPLGKNPDRQSEAITTAQKELNDLRIRTFATFPLDNEKDPMMQMREQLAF